MVDGEELDASNRTCSVAGSAVWGWVVCAEWAAPSCGSEEKQGSEFRRRRAYPLTPVDQSGHTTRAPRSTSHTFHQPSRSRPCLPYCITLLGPDTQKSHNNSMFGVSITTPTFLAAALTLTPPEQWSRLQDRYVGVALHKEQVKRQHWQAILDDTDSSNAVHQFYVENGRLHLGPSAAYTVQLLGVEGMDSFLWAWALTDDMKEADPTLNLPNDVICYDLKQHPALQMDSSDKESSSLYFPEFAAEEPIPLSLTHSGETLGVVAAGVLGDACRAIYQVPDYNTGLVCYWIVTDDSYPLVAKKDQQSTCAQLSTVLQAMAHPSASHRIGSFTTALEGYAAALNMTVVPNDEGTQLTATPRDTFWGDSLTAFVDPNHDKLTGISARYDNALHTTWVVYDEEGKFEKFDEEPVVDLATGLPRGNDEKEEDSEGKAPAINGAS